jgi:hypothetical protein
MNRIEEVLGEVQRRLTELGLPAEPADRWTGIDDSADIEKQVALRVDAVTEQLYATVTHGREALKARATGDWEQYTRAVENLVLSRMAANIPEIRERIQRDRQRELGRRPRNLTSWKARAKRVFLESSPQPGTAKDLMDAMHRQGLLDQMQEEGESLTHARFQNWIAEFKKLDNP